MKSKIIAVIIASAVFILAIIALLFMEQKGESEPEKEEVIKVAEGESCNPAEKRICETGFSCEEGVCFPKIDYQEIIDPEEEQDFYRVALSGPYKKDYILHVDRLVISENLYVWVGDKNKPYWFKARRETKLRPYEIKVPAGNSIRINLMNQEKKVTPEFRGKIYLTKP